MASVGAGLMVAAVQGLIGGVAFWALGVPAPAVWARGDGHLLVAAGGRRDDRVGPGGGVDVPVGRGHARRSCCRVICAVVLGSADNVLRPLLLSGRTSASGLVVFIGLLGGASAFGFVGLVLGPIVLVIAGTLIDALTRRVHLTPDDTGVIEAP